MLQQESSSDGNDDVSLDLFDNEQPRQVVKLTKKMLELAIRELSNEGFSWFTTKIREDSGHLSQQCRYARKHSIYG